MFICQHCQKEKKNHNSWRNHERTCPSNPNRIYKNGMLGKAPWNKGLNKEDHRVLKHSEQVSKALKGRPSSTVWTDEMRKAKSEWRKQLHKDFPETHPNRRLAGNKKKMSYPEQVAANWLDAKNIAYEHNKRIGRYYPDFVIDNIIIEIDGKRWHNEEKDKTRDLYLLSEGYVVFRIKAEDRIEDKLEILLGVGKSG